ncbi:MAG TPA: sensor histidine kinase [Alphaproteobacteria bacterium]|nr:sensor histidine kinase [Alphaproteobacteria bacterium]
MTAGLEKPRRDAAQPAPLLTRIWRSYLRSALVPLLVVQILSLGAYWIAHLVSRGEVMTALGRQVEAEIRNLAEHEAALVGAQLEGVATSLEVFRRRAEQAIGTPCEPDPAEVARYAVTADGILHTVRDDGGAALFYSGIVPIGPVERMKAYCSARLDPLMRDLMASHRLIDQIYVNTHDSMNRIYPWLPVVEQFPPRMDIPSYSFYYLADAIHNPARQAVWTDAYLDPAGQGWITSVVAPIYEGNRLTAVVGIDITVATLIRNVLVFELPWQGYAMLIGADGTILGLPGEGQEDWDLAEIVAGATGRPVGRDVFRPASYNFYNHPDAAGIADEIGGSLTGVGYFDLRGASKVAAWSTVPDTGWKLLLIADRGRAFDDFLLFNRTQALISYAMVALLLTLYGGFFWMLYRRARRMSEDIAEPLVELGTIMRRIAQGEWQQKAPAFDVLELRAAGDELVRMSAKLGDAHRRLLSMQEELRAAKETAETANRAKSRFLASMSHELRTPLNAILGFSEVIRDQMFGPIGQRRYVEYAKDIHDSGGHLLDLVNDVLDLSKIEAGKFELYLETVSVGRSIEEAANLLARRAEERGIELVRHNDPQLAPIQADRRALKQMLLNLLSNALKFTPNGGRITIAARQENGMVAVIVADTGIGIPAHDLEKVMLPFEESGRRRPDDAQGAGLGLPIVKALIEMHHGRLQLDSVEGRGTTATLYFPGSARTDARLLQPGAA